MSVTAISGDDSQANAVVRDRQSVLHPFTPAHAHRAGSYPVTVMAGGSGVYVVDDTGRRFLDGFAGLYCVNVGYGRMEIADAIAAQAHRLAFYHSYAGHTTDGLAKLASRLTVMAPGNMQKVFFGLSGSDANETQAKIVWYYNNLRGMPRKKKIISRERGYHGCSVISGSMTGLRFYHEHMDLPFSLILHTGVPHHYWGAHPGESEEEFSARRATELDALIKREGPDTVGAFIAEPVLGTGGLIPPPKLYWESIQQVLHRHDVLMIADEVVCGFGRLGTPFGCDMYGITPDLITVAKGLTSAYAPLSGVMIGSKVYEVIERASDTIGSFSHGYTYSGHPISIAAANANLDILERENVTQQAQQRGAYLQRCLIEAFRDRAYVGEVRGVGMLAAVEFVEDPSTKRPFPAGSNFAATIAQEARNRDVIVRAMPHGEIIGFAPPLIMSEVEIDELVGKVAEATQVVADAYRRR